MGTRIVFEILSDTIGYLGPKAWGKMRKTSFLKIGKFLGLQKCKKMRFRSFSNFFTFDAHILHSGFARKDYKIFVVEKHIFLLFYIYMGKMKIIFEVQ